MSALLHRDRELAAVDRALAGLRAGRPAVVMIEGGRGAGKSALLQAALGRGPDSAVTLRARCHATEREFALGVVSQLFDRIGNGDRQAAGPGSDAPGHTGDGSEHDLLRGYYQITRAVAADRPVIIAIDDLQHADSLSARWCSYLARRLDDLPVAMVLTVDSDTHTADGSVEELRTELTALAYSSQIRVGPLDPEGAGDLIAAAFGAPADPVFAVRCHALAQGNPQIIKAIAARLAASGPVPATDCPVAIATAARALADVTLDWIRHADPVKARLIEQFAVCPGGTMETAAMVLGWGEDVATTTRAALRRYGLLTARPPDQFAHPAMREAILDRLSPQALNDLHIRAATVLSRVGAPAATVAGHIMSIGAVGEPWAQSVLRQAARDAAADGDWHTASRYLSRALLEPSGPAPMLGIMSELGAVEYHRDVRACLQRLLTAAELAGDEPARCAVLAAFAEPALTLESAPAAERFRRAAACLAAAPRPDRAALLRLAAQSLLSGQDAGVPQAVRRLGSGPGDAASRQLLAVQALSVAGHGRSRHRCLQLARRGTGGDPASGTDPLPSTGALAALALAWAGEFRAAADTCAQALEGARGQESPASQALALVVRAEIAYRRGNLGAAMADLQQARGLCQSAGAYGLGAAALASLARVLLVRGENDAIPAKAREFDPNASGHAFISGLEQETRGMMAAGRGDHRQALRLYLDCGRHLVAGGLQNPACSAWRSRAVVTLVGLGRICEARELSDSELALARIWGAPGPLGRALVAAATAYDRPGRLELLDEAVQVLDGSECTLDLARALIRLGSAHREIGDNRAARAALNRGLELAIACGGASLTAAARQALQAAGGRTTEDRGQTVLTAGERRVAELVILGLGNQEVAARLSISKRTVDTHLGRIYRKLGISGRNRLREALSDPAE